MAFSQERKGEDEKEGGGWQLQGLIVRRGRCSRWVKTWKGDRRDRPWKMHPLSSWEVLKDAKCITFITEESRKNHNLISLKLTKMGYTWSNIHVWNTKKAFVNIQRSFLKKLSSQTKSKLSCRLWKRNLFFFFFQIQRIDPQSPSCPLCVRLKKRNYFYYLMYSPWKLHCSFIPIPSTLGSFDRIFNQRRKMTKVSMISNTVVPNTLPSCGFISCLWKTKQQWKTKQISFFFIRVVFIIHIYTLRSFRLYSLFHSGRGTANGN